MNMVKDSGIILVKEVDFEIKQNISISSHQVVKLENQEKHLVFIFVILLVGFSCAIL